MTPEAGQIEGHPAAKECGGDPGPVAQAFAPGEKRPLDVRADRIDAAYVVAGEPPAVEARLVEIDTSPARHGPRGYLLTDLPRAVAAKGQLTVKLWNGDPADDEDRLRDITESALSPLTSNLSPERSE